MKKIVSEIWVGRHKNELRKLFHIDEVIYSLFVWKSCVLFFAKMWSGRTFLYERRHILNLLRLAIKNIYPLVLPRFYELNLHHITLTFTGLICRRVYQETPRKLFLSVKISWKWHATRVFEWRLSGSKFTAIKNFTPWYTRKYKIVIYLFEKMIW